jgi:phosphatidylinositol N-acetylglucosaminyltransferase subunit Q
MLFTLVAFLSPTILVYYGLFAAVSTRYVAGGSLLNPFKARLIIILIHATSETLLAFMNHFPLFVLMLRIKDPRRLPGGIVFAPTQSDKDINGATLTLKVRETLYV